MTFVDSIVSGSEQKRRFVFTQNGGGEAAEGEKGGTLTAAQILLRQNEPFNVNTLFYINGPLRKIRMLTYLKGLSVLHANTQSRFQQIVQLLLHVETVCWLTFSTSPTLSYLHVLSTQTDCEFGQMSSLTCFLHISKMNNLISFRMC